MAASWQEIDRLRKDPAAFRALANRLLNLGVELTDWERTFLESVCNGPDFQKFTTRQTETLLQLRDHQESAAQSKKAKKLRDEKEYSTRQSEKLFQIRDDYEIITKFHGFNVGILLKRCYEARLDLSESQEARIIRMYEKSQTSARRKDIGFLMHCARQLYIIEEEVVD
ncbi:MAG: hypothetical protein ABSA90_16920 [Xanthobacteraceae bacterium]|jgi:hypothetical protein